MSAIRDWLSALSLSQYAELFEREQIDLAAVPLLTDADLRELGLPTGPRVKLLAAVRALRQRGANPGDPVEQDADEHRSGEASMAGPAAGAAAERRQLTVMFCDLVGSTELARKLDPEEYRELLHAFRDACQRAMQRYEGHVAQQLGDGMLVYFGYPQAHEDDAQRAVRAALEAQGAVSSLRSAAGPLAMRVGIHTGLTVVGGSGEGLALGDTPNVAARLQALAQPGVVIVSEATRRLIGERFHLESLGKQALKGVDQPLETFQVRADAAGTGVAGSHARQTPMVGRDQETALLLDRWERAVEGEGQVVVIVGEPGIGKSRMVRALDESLAGVSHNRLELRCSPYYTHTPLYPVIERLPERLGWKVADTPDVEVAKLVQFLSRLHIPLEESVGLLAALLSRPVPDGYSLPVMSPERQRRRTLETLTSIVLALAKETPTLLAVEDLHWADPTTLDLIGRHIEQAPTERLLLVLTARAGFEVPWPVRSYVTSLSLHRLTRRQTDDLVQRLTGGKALPAEVAEQIVAKTDGVPLFVEELTTMVLESGLVRDSGSQYELTGPLPPLAIPSTLQDSLNARLDRLSGAKAIAQLGATLGRTFAYPLLRAVSPADDATLDSALSKLVDAELLFQRGTPPQVTYTFKHALVQEAAYQSLLKSTRQQVHQRIAQTIVERLPADAEQRPEYVAHHYTEAGLPVLAVPWWRRAGEAAVQRSAYSEAIAHYRRAVEVLSTLPESVERDRLELDLQLALGSAIVPAMGYAAPEAKAAYRRACDLGARVDDSPRLCDALWGIAVGEWVGGDVNEAHRVGHRFLALAKACGDNASLVAAHHSFASTAMAKGLFADARAHFDETLSLYGPSPRPELTPRYGQDPKANAVQFLVPTLWFLGYPDQALARQDELASYWADSPFLYNRIWRSVSLVQTLAWARAPAELDTYIDHDLAICDEQGFGFMGHVIRTLRGARLAQNGHAEAGINDLKEGIAVHFSLGARFAVPVYLEFLAEAYLSVGENALGLAAIEQGLAISSNGGERRVDAELHRLRGELLLAMQPEHAQAAEASFLEALRIARDQEGKSFELRTAASLARLWLRQGRADEAHQLLRPIYGWFTEGFGRRDLIEAKALLDELGDGGNLR